MLDVANCERCSTIIINNGRTNLCQNCIKIDNTWYKTVYDFLRKRDNRLASVLEVIENTGVNEKWLYSWIRSGKIPQRLFPNLGVPCKRCSINLTSGTILCDLCRNDLISGL